MGAIYKEKDYHMKKILIYLKQIEFRRDGLYQITPWYHGKILTRLISWPSL